MVVGGAPESVQGEGLQPYGALDCFEWRPKGTGGERKAPSAPAGAYPLLCTPSTARRGCRGASGKPPCLQQQATTLPQEFPLAGLDAPTPAREENLQPYETLYCFGWRSEGVQGGT